MRRPRRSAGGSAPSRLPADCQRLRTLFAPLPFMPGNHSRSWLGRSENQNWARYMSAHRNDFCSHGIWPCNICGTKHFDKCECYFCVSPERQAEYDRQKLKNEARRAVLRAEIDRLSEELESIR